MTTPGQFNHLSIVSDPWKIASLVKPDQLQLVIRPTSKSNTQTGQFMLMEPGLSVGRPFFLQLSGCFAIPPPNAMSRSPSLCVNLNTQPIEVQIGMLGIFAFFFKNADQIIANLPKKPRTVCVSPATYAKEVDLNSQCQMYGNISTDTEERLYNVQNPEFAHQTHLLLYNVQTGKAEYAVDDNDPMLGPKIEQFSGGNYLTFNGIVVLRLQVYESLILGQRHIKFHPDPSVICLRSFIRPFLSPMEGYFNSNIDQLTAGMTEEETEEVEPTKN